MGFLSLACPSTISGSLCGIIATDVRKVSNYFIRKVSNVQGRNNSWATL